MRFWEGRRQIDQKSNFSTQERATYYKGIRSMTFLSLMIRPSIYIIK
jgi:hypothetical protein